MLARSEFYKISDTLASMIIAPLLNREVPTGVDDHKEVIWKCMCQIDE